MTERQTDVSYELGNIKGSLDTIMRTLSENRTADAQYRTGVRQEMAATTAAMNDVKTDMALAKKDISEMKPTVKSLDERAAMSKGAQNFAILLSRFAHVVSAGIGGIIVLLIDRYFFGRHG